jgi:hypothetical protein
MFTIIIVVAGVAIGTAISGAVGIDISGILDPSESGLLSLELFGVRPPP